MEREGRVGGSKGRKVVGKEVSRVRGEVKWNRGDDKSGSIGGGEMGLKEGKRMVDSNLQCW